MESTLSVLKAAGANLAIETISIGEKLYLSGHSSGIAPESWDSLRRTKIFLKAPITTPIGGGYKSEGGGDALFRPYARRARRTANNQWRRIWLRRFCSPLAYHLTTFSRGPASQAST